MAGEEFRVVGLYEGLKQWNGGIVARGWDGLKLGHFQGCKSCPIITTKRMSEWIKIGTIKKLCIEHWYARFLLIHIGSLLFFALLVLPFQNLSFSNFASFFCIMELTNVSSPVVLIVFPSMPGHLELLSAEFVCVAAIVVFLRKWSGWRVLVSFLAHIIYSLVGILLFGTAGA